MSVLQKDWQLKYAVVKERSGHILQSGTWADCKFLVGRRVPRVYLSGHKLILAMASPVFEAMFYGEIAEKDAIHIPDVEPESFQAMLDYIYTDKIKVESFDEAAALYYCGNKYMLPYLTEGCVKYLLESLNSTNVCQTYEFAKMFDEYDLMDKCLQLIQSRTPEVLNNDSLLEAKINTVQDIFSLTPLNVENELELFKAAVRYAKANGSNSNESSVHGSLDNLQQDFERNEENDQQYKTYVGHTADNKPQKAKDDENVSRSWDKEESIFRNLLDKILLLTLTPQQFAEGVARSPYITQGEAFAILMNIASSSTDVAIPKGFNESRKQRYRLVGEPAYNQDLGIETSKTRSQTKFRFTIPDFKNSKTKSMPFVVRKLSWRIAVNPKPEKGMDEECLGIFLYCDYIDKKAIWSCSAIAEMNIISNKSNAVHLLKKVEHTFTSSDKNRGSIIPMEIILDPKNGYVKNDTIVIEVNLAAQEPNDQQYKTYVGHTADNKPQKAKDDENVSRSWDKEESIFRNLLDKILLLTLTPQQFAEGVARSPYITQGEAFAILMNIASSSTDVAIPKGFNESRKQRYRLVGEPAYNQDLGIETSKTRSQTKFRFTIPDFKNSKTKSMPFVVRKLSWRIAVNPKPEKGMDEECLGIFLYCDYIDKKAIWSCSAIAEMNIISNKSNAVHLLKKVEHTFTSSDKNRGSIIPMEIILDPKNGYVKNDTIVIEVNLAAQEPVGI